MTDKEKKYFFDKISILRKGLQMLEEELGRGLEPPKKRITKKEQLRQEFINMYQLGDRRVPAHLKKAARDKRKAQKEK